VLGSHVLQVVAGFLQLLLGLMTMRLFIFDAAIGIFNVFTMFGRFQAQLFFQMGDLVVRILVVVHYLAAFVLDQILTGLVHVDDRRNVSQELHTVTLHAVQTLLDATAAGLKAAEFLWKEIENEI
jgi:hypothetical protein